MLDKNDLVVQWRNQLQQGNFRIRVDFESYGNTRKMLHEQCRHVDDIVASIWREFQFPFGTTIVAVGGYGRGSLFPQSDVDILVLLSTTPDDGVQAQLENLIGIFWDIGLSIGHSVRTLAECLEEATKDVTTMTNLIESRFIAGNQTCYRDLQNAISNAINPRDFFIAKKQEQDRRYTRFNDTAYILEPNLKESPGGMRDIHNILWIARAINRRASWSSMVKENLISASEARQIQHHFAFLSNLRIRLHYLSGRREDRLLFDHQDALARQIGFKSNERRSASEQLMQRYYHSVRFISLMNEILLQSLHERLFYSADEPVTAINAHFQSRKGMLEACDTKLFLENPHSIFESFLTLRLHPELTGFSPNTIRALVQARRSINQKFRADAENQLNFMRVFRAQDGILHALRRMHHYGILGRYLPVFGRITGQMQHDLFHVYTVDEHTLNVLRNMRRYAVAAFSHEFPLCSKLMQNFERREVLYIAIIFHDIAKGRGGDHSELGAKDALLFCRKHHIGKADTQLIVWLVEKHLVLSSTAQRQDISDPEVVSAFAKKIPDIRHLNALYLLTVADIRGTSPNVWNAWKSRLLETLYHATLRLLQGRPTDTNGEIKSRKAQSQEILSRYGISAKACEPLWRHLDDAYFMRYDAKEIAWQSRLLLTHINSTKPIVRARLSPNGDGIQVMIYTQDQDDLFARICAFFDRLAYSIVEARIHTTKHGYALDSFLILDSTHHDVRYSDLIAHIENELSARIISSMPPERPLEGRVNRQAKHFPMQAKVTIQREDHGSGHSLSIISSDRPGLLSRVAHVLLLHGACLQMAKINTLGNRAEDTFVISGRDHTALPLSTIEKIKQTLEMSI